MCLLTSVCCGTYFVYRPRGDEEIDQQSRDLCYGLKGGREDLVNRAAAHISRHGGVQGVRGVLGKDALLVPMPRSSPLMRGAFWPSRFLAEALVDHSMGIGISPLLERTKAVRKSSASGPGKRPLAKDHFDSIEVSPLVLPTCRRIVVVDDVVTRGATMVAAVTRLVAAYPNLSVFGFAFVRTMSFEAISSKVNPAHCRITLQANGRTNRSP